MRRIGLVGTESTHVEHFLRLLNVERRHPGATATALVGGPSERNRRLAADGGVETIVAEPADLVGPVDAAVVATRDGAQHLEDARPLLEAGLAVLVDKPLATSVDDADALLTLARGHGALLTSASALRFAPEIAELSAAAEPRHLHVVGPADPDSEHSGLFFYGIHHVEAALEILGNPVVDSCEVTTTRRGDTTVACVVIADVHVTLTFVTPAGEARAPFHATVVTPTGVVAHELTLGPDYTAPVLAEFLRTLNYGRPHLSAAQLRSPVVVLAAVVQALREDDR